MSEFFSASQVQKLFPIRKDNSNKSDYGYIALVGGCVKYSGAVRLAALASSAMRSGAGVCTIAAPKSLTSIVLPQILESTFQPLTDNEGDFIFKESEFKSMMSRNDVIAFGMGIGNTEETRSAVSYLLTYYEGILLVDADGINAMAKLDKKLIRSFKGKLIITPHPKEFSRLSGMDVKEVLANPERNAMNLAADLNAIILLKGHISYATDGHLMYKINKGCAGMATAGSGDVLSGIMAAVLASNKDYPLLAAAGAAYINGFAGELAAKKHGSVCMVASDTAACVEEAVRTILDGADDPDAKSISSVSLEYARKIGSASEKIINSTTEKIKKSGTETASKIETVRKSTSDKIKSKSDAAKEKGQNAFESIKEFFTPDKEELELFEDQPEGKFKSYIKIAIAALFIALIGGAVWFASTQLDSGKNADTREIQESYDVEMAFVYKDFYIDGVLVNNYQLNRPFGAYNGKIYVPLTADVCAALGITASWDHWNIQEIYIASDEPNHAGAFSDLFGWNPAEIKVLSVGNADVIISDGEEEEILYPDASEVLSYNNGEVVYLPISMLANSEKLHISVYYDDIGGLYISTDDEIPAESYINENNMAYIQARAEYIVSFQPQMKLGDGAYYEYIFRHEANTREISEDLLIAIARTESRFNRFATSGAGARGIMQIMPDTAKANGIDPDTLYDIHVCIQFGSGYIRDAITNFKGDMLKALSVYNFGGNAVLAGAYDTAYAQTVLSRMESMQAQFIKDGYSNEFYTIVECTK